MPTKEHLGMMPLLSTAPLSEIEIEEWLMQLSPTILGRIKAIRDLLRHAGEDHMSETDRVICRSELVRLEARLATGESPHVPATRCPGQCGLPPHSGISCDEALEQAERILTGTDGRLAQPAEADL